MDQVREHTLAPNPAKTSDTRFNSYADQYGDESWELDALDPTIIDGLIRIELEQLVDFDAWNAVLAKEEKDKAVMAAAATRWGEVSAFLSRPDYE